MNKQLVLKEPVIEKERRKKARAYLARFAMLKKASEDALRDLEWADSMKNGIAAISGGGGGSGSSSGDKVAMAAIGFIEHSDMLEKLAPQLSEAYMQRLSLLLDVNDANAVHGEVLQGVYAEGMSIPDVAEGMNFERRYGYKLHDKALDSACDMIEKPPYRRNPILLGQRRGCEYFVCRDCKNCSIAFRPQFPDVLNRDLGWCDAYRDFVDPDEARRPDDVADCYEG